MKILVFGRGVPNEEYPQEGCFEWDQVQCLKKAKHEVIYMYLDGRYRRKGHKWGINETVIEGVPVYSIYWGTLSYLYRLKAYRLGDFLLNQLALKLFKYIINNNKNIDIVHSHYLGCNNRAIGFKKISHIPIVGTEHLSDMVKANLSNYLFLLGDKTYKNLDQLITVSQFLQKNIAKKFGVNSLICSNVLGHEFEDLKLKTKEDDEKVFTFIACGSLLKRKGFDILIEAAGKLKLSKDCWKIDIIGSGPLKEELQEIIQKYKLENNIRLVGQCNKKQIVKLYTDSDCFILSSRSETFGVVVIEALSCGLPSIVTRCGGTEDIMDESSGVYVPIEDSDALANAMEFMYKNKKNYDPITIRKKCLNKYSSESISKELTKIYKKVIKV